MAPNLASPSGDPNLRAPSEAVYSYLITAISPVVQSGRELRFRGRLAKKNGEFRIHDVVVENMTTCPDLVERVHQALRRGETRMLISFARQASGDIENAQLSRLSVIARVENIPEPSKRASTATRQLTLPF